MIDADYFLQGLSRQVQELGGTALVSITLHAGGDFYVRDVVETHQGHVLLNIWHGEAGRPIASPSSSAYTEELPSGHHPVAIAFESISCVNVLPAETEIHRRIGFRT